MLTYEIRDPDLARRHLLDSLLLSRTAPLNAETLRRALPWTLELAANGDPLPPVGFIADVGNLAFGLETAPRHHDELLIVPGYDRSLVRRYDDYVLGKLYADASFGRGADALARYQGRERVRGLAYLIAQVHRRAGIGGALLSPAVIKAMLHEPVDKLVANAWSDVQRSGATTLVVKAYEELVAAFYNLGHTLGAEDIFELEHGTAVADFGQRVALRQVLQAADLLERGLAKTRGLPSSTRRSVATFLLDEDVYPVGGFTSISNRGSIESLLHSQLAYMERDERPDLFDVKYLRDELLYYSRDENQFLRRRRRFIFVLYPDLAQARFKDAAAPFQRIIFVLALLVSAVRKLTEWLSGEALRFEVLILDFEQLAAEEELLQTLFRDQMSTGQLIIQRMEPHRVAGYCHERANRALSAVLMASLAHHDIAIKMGRKVNLVPLGPSPHLEIDGVETSCSDEESSLDAWRETLRRLLDAWIQ